MTSKSTDRQAYITKISSKHLLKITRKNQRIHLHNQNIKKMITPMELHRKKASSLTTSTQESYS